MNDGNRGWAKFTPNQALWTDNGTGAAYPNYCNFGANAGNNYTYPAANHSDVSGRSDGTGGDCDLPGAEGAEGTTSPNFTTDAYSCGTMPRYRHGGNTVSNFLFCDRHAKTLHKGGINWSLNIYVKGPYEENTNNGYGNC